MRSNLINIKVLKPDGSDKSFNRIMQGRIWYYFLFTLFFLLILICLFNYLIDPYGHYGTDVLNMQMIDPRAGIVRKLTTQIQPPDLLVFGSSRCLRLRPNYNQNYYGVNASLFAGTIEDYYCILRYAIDDLKYPIKVIVVGLEPDLMLNSHPTDIMLIRNNKLNPWLEQKNNISGIQSFFQEPSCLKELSSILSIKTIRNSCKLVLQFYIKKINIVPDTSAEEKNSTSNMQENTLIEKFVSVKDSMDARLRQYKRIYSGGIDLDLNRINYLYKFAQFAFEKRIRVIMFYPGYSMKFWEEMSKLTSFKKMHLVLDGHIKKLKREYGWEILDFRPKHWIGPSLDFFDGVHPTNQTARIIDNTIKGLINHGI